MPKFKPFFFASLVVLGLAACEPVNFNKADAAASSDSSASDSSSRSDASADVVVNLNSCENRCGAYAESAKCQCDAQCIPNGDCCGNFVKFCAVQQPDKPDATSTPADTTADVAQNPPAGSCTDVDKDNYCDKATTPDCNDLDSSINPGAVEICGNGKDDNCKDGIDENCPAAAANVLTITYTSAFNRVLNVQVTSVKADLGKYWDSGSVSATGTTLTKDLGVIPAATCLYVRWNVIDSNPATPYGSACIGNGSTANMDQNAVSSLKLHGKSYTKAEQFTWSAPGGPNAGCSGVFVEGTGCTP